MVSPRVLRTGTRSEVEVRVPADVAASTQKTNETESHWHFS